MQNCRLCGIELTEEPRRTIWEPYCQDCFNKLMNDTPKLVKEIDRLMHEEEIRVLHNLIKDRNYFKNFYTMHVLAPIGKEKRRK